MMSDTQPLDRPALRLHEGQVPAFTVQDMTTYLHGAPCSSFGPTFSGDPPTIETLEFVGCEELTGRLNLWIGLTDDAPVCYVVLRGPFVLRSISLPPGHPGGPAYSETVFEIYDASTGRLIVKGVGDGKPRPGY
ncbi:MAG: hypothetical protein ACRDHE_07420 [Ktedonobacterales bacterium]